jgi:hypothetical protein
VETCNLTKGDDLYRHTEDGSVIPLEVAEKNPGCARFPKNDDVLAAYAAEFPQFAANGRGAGNNTRVDENSPRLPNGQLNPNYLNRSGGWNRHGCIGYRRSHNDCAVRWDDREQRCKCQGGID